MYLVRTAHGRDSPYRGVVLEPRNPSPNYLLRGFHRCGKGRCVIFEALDGISMSIENVL
jgi:hypothetical protein